jgi:uncharacterized DUF497 family protein
MPGVRHVAGNLLATAWSSCRVGAPPYRVRWSRLKFEWDAKKAAANAKKHGVTFEEASTAFADWDSITVPDPDHSIGEQRWYPLGVSERGNLLVVSHTERKDTFRVISAWKANRRQRKQYEEQFEEER